MPKVLPFSLRRGRTLPSKKYRYFILKDDALREKGGGPCRGDICRVALGEISPGLTHILETNGGQVLCGTLTFEGNEIVLSFPNKHYPPYRRRRDCITIVGRVVKFFYSVSDAEDDAEPFLEGDREMYLPWREPSLHVTFDNPAEAFINWQADAAGNILSASPNARELLEPLPRTWHYIRLVHPDERRAVALAWMRAVNTGSHFSFQFEAWVGGCYRPVKNMAIPVLDKETGKVLWFGTLHLLSRIKATGS